jgi:uncharacterized protein (TIGR00106 family)
LQQGNLRRFPKSAVSNKRKEAAMLVELSIVPLGTGTQISDQIAEALEVVDASGVPYQLTPAGTCIEGEWDDVMPLVRQCHERVRALSPHVFTTIRIEDEEGARDKLTRNVASVEEKVGHALKRPPSS